MTDFVDEVATESGFVLGDPGRAMAVADDGISMMPVSVGCIDLARREEWDQYEIGPEFNAIFYAALLAVGMDRETANRELLDLVRHRLSFKMTKIQCRVAYGIQKGVMGRDGRFKPGPLNGTDWELKLMQARARHAERSTAARLFDPLEWSRIETDALAACMGLPDQVDIAVEFRWIRSNLHQTPYFKDAPSQGAIKDWLTIMGKDVSPMLREFTSVAWSKRLSPGDRKSKSKSAFVEDEAGEAGDEAAARDAAAFKRLFGDMKEKS